MKTEAGYLITAVAVSGTVTVAAPAVVGHEFLDDRLWIYAVGFGVVWTVYRAAVFAFAWLRWRSWRWPAGWSMRSQDLVIESARGWLPIWWARRLYSRMPAKWKKRLYADKGILLGRGFRWGPEHTQKLEDHLQGGQALPVGRDVRGGHPALHAVGRRNEQPLVLPWSELVGHVLIGGTTRSGKTRLLEVIVSEAIRGPGTVIIIDPKGDAELLVRTAAECYRMGREFAFFSPAHADQSASFNPFSMCKTTTELAARVQALMPGGGGMAKGDPFFTEYPLAVVERLGAAQHAVGDGWTIEGLHAVTTMVPPFDDLVARYLYRVLGGTNKHTPPLEEVIEEYAGKRREKQDPLADALVDDKEKPRDHFVQVTANLVPAFRGVTGGKMARLLSSRKPDLTWKGVVEKRKVVYFAMSSLLYGEVANRIGR
ncbi:MAG: type IV secretory system conjugative DNA transfer family protein, partial [Candidatus Tectomicrobia bacterium]|nr:type IV secretory system conjugative DNA transfer family protein [Candidatus Tectomicrobia bacterium]